MVLRIPYKPIHIINDVTLNRAPLTIYTNNTGKDLFIAILARCFITGAGSYSVNYIEIEEDGSFIRHSTLGAEDSPIQTIYTTITGVIKPEARYRWITSSGNGSVTLDRWIEYY